MPVEIRELVIKAVVNESTQKGASKGEQGSAAPEAIVQVCIDRVLEILKDQKER